MLASMARGDRFRSLMAPVRSAWHTVYGFAATVSGLAFVLVVRGLSLPREAVA